MTNKWEKFDTQVVKDKHGDVYFFRDLYEGKHSELFPRAKELVEKGEITDRIIFGEKTAKDIKTPYIVANICKLIVEVPATFVARSIGTITTSLKNPEASEDEEEELPIEQQSIENPQAIDLNKQTEDLIDGPEDGLAFNTEVLNKQQELIKQIVKNSKLDMKHYGNLIQQQVDGGLVGVPVLDEDGIRIVFKSRDVYYPHDDEKGVDITLEETYDGKDYLHVMRNRQEKGNIRVTHMLYELNSATRRTTEIPADEAQTILKLPRMEYVVKGRSTPFIEYWANDETFMNPLGVSALKNQDGKQDEVNWTLTRSGLTYERNGRPRVSVTPGIMESLKEEALEKYGDERMIDSKNLEITEMDEQGRAIQVHQIDVSKIGDVKWAKDLMEIMLSETQTSERAVDFYSDGNNAQTGIAKYYDLLTSLMKAERLQRDYVRFLKRLVEGALFLQNRVDNAVIIEEPEIELGSMLPISRKELLEENKVAYDGIAQSRETTVRRNNPTASEEWIQDELERIEAEEGGSDSISLATGQTNMVDYLQNRRAQTPAATLPTEESEEE